DRGGVVGAGAGAGPDRSGQRLASGRVGQVDGLHHPGVGADRRGPTRPVCDRRDRVFRRGRPGRGRRDHLIPRHSPHGAPHGRVGWLGSSPGAGTHLPLAGREIVVDPLSAMLLALMVSGMTVQTVTASLADRRAARAGRTPPSKQQHEHRQDQRAAAGQPREPDPGPWRRRWRNAAEVSTEKAAQKQAARMEYLRDNAESTKAAHRKRIERRAARRARVGTILAGWGQSTWEGSKNAAVQAREARIERKAWRETTHRQPGTDTPVLSRTKSGAEGAVAPVIPISASSEGSDVPRAESPAGSDPEASLSEHQRDVVARRRASWTNGDLASGQMTQLEWESLPVPVRDRLVAEAAEYGDVTRQAHPDGSTTEVRTSDTQQDPRYGRLRITTTSEGGTRIQSGQGITGNSDIYGIADDSATWTGTDRYGRDIQTGRGESRDVTAPGGAPSVVHPNNLIGSRSHSPERDVV